MENFRTKKRVKDLKIGDFLIKVTNDILLKKIRSIDKSFDKCIFINGVKFLNRDCFKSVDKTHFVDKKTALLHLEEILEKKEHKASEELNYVRSKINSIRNNINSMI